MALIGKIRNNMWLVFIIIALATASFILMDAMGPGGGSFGGANANTPVGIVAGQKIKQPEFESAYQALFNNSQNANASREALWNFFVENGVVRKEAENLGMYIGEDELSDLQFGANMSPIIRNNFTNPTTGVLDVAQLQQIKNQFESGGAINPQLQNFWNEQTRQVEKEQLQTKISSLAQKAIYTPNWLAESGYSEENASFDMAVVKVPFDNIPAADITVSDADINNYINKNKEQYERTEEKRQATYLTFDIVPSAEDSARLLSQANEVIEGFRTTPNDSAYAIANNGFYSNGYGKASQIDEFYKDKVASYEIGQAYGPYIVGPSYQGVKLIDKRVLPDSVKVRHILKTVPAGNTAREEEANRIIDSLQIVLTRNKSKFADLAKEFSDDTSNKEEGGDMGYFAYGSYSTLKEFSDVCFLTGRAGNIYKVRTQIGVQLVYIEDQVYNDRLPGYQLAYVTTPIIPGDETETAGYDAMIDLASSYPYLSDLRTQAASNPNITIATSSDLGANDYNIQELGDDRTTRDIVKWVFDRKTSVNDVSQNVYEYTDPINYFTSKYVVVGLEAIKAPGMPDVSEVRGQVEFVVLNELKGQKAVSEISGTDLNAIAAKYNVRIDTMRNLNLLNNFVQGLGNEPKVLGAAFGQDNGAVSSPILGNSGVFVTKTLSKSPAGEVTDIGFIKRTISGTKKSGIQFSLLEALKERHDVKDNRAIFY